MSITPKAIQDARRFGSVKAEPVARSERTATAPLSSFRGWKRSDPATGQEDIRCRGRSLGTCFDEIFPHSERLDESPRGRHRSPVRNKKTLDSLFEVPLKT